MNTFNSIHICQGISYVMKCNATDNFTVLVSSVYTTFFIPGTLEDESVKEPW